MRDGLFGFQEVLMPEHKNIQHEVNRFVGYPINLQSLLQTFVLITALISGVVYAAQRLTTLENKQEFQQQTLSEQKEILKELRDYQRTSLENQRRLLSRDEEKRTK